MIVQKNEFSFQVAGPCALFSDPVTRIGGQKCSYPVPTYGALKGITKNIYHKPCMQHFIRRIRVMNPICMESKGVRPIHYQDSKNDLAYYTYLADVCYQVEGYFEWNQNRPEFQADWNVNKHGAIMERSIREGGRRPIFLGTRDGMGFVEPCVFGSGVGAYDSLDKPMGLGLMLHGITYPDEAYSDATRGMMTVQMWHAVMQPGGIIEFPRPEECTLSKFIRPMKMKVFDVRKGDD